MVRELRRVAGSLKPHQLTPLHVAQLVARWKQDYSRATTYQRAVALRKFFRFLRNSGGPDYSHDVPRVPCATPRKRIATQQELELLLTRANPLLRTVLVLILDTACRISEALQICPEHYDAERKMLTVPQVKGHEPREVPAGQRLQQLFETLPQALPMTTVAAIVHGQPVNYDLIEHAWLALKKRTGVDPGLRFHDLRRTTATALHEVSKDILAVQQLLGHRTLHATTYYLSNVDPEKLRPLLKLLERPGKQERIQ